VNEKSGNTRQTIIWRQKERKSIRNYERGSSEDWRKRVHRKSPNSYKTISGFLGGRGEAEDTITR
jgi:hypothetical protein